MINRNIGKKERVARLLLAIALIGWVVGGAGFGVPQGLALLASFALLWNSIFARCYLWQWLGLNSCDGEAGGCSNSGGRDSRA